MGPVLWHCISPGPGPGPIPTQVLSEQECIPVGCILAARGPCAGVYFPGGGLLWGGLVRGVWGGLLQGVSAQGGLVLGGGGLILGGGGLVLGGGGLLLGGVLPAWGVFSLPGGVLPARGVLPA